jgi:uncharacterized membrane protein (Fun14 family)
MASEVLLSNIIPFAGSGLVGYAIGFALKKILKWMLIIVGFLACGHAKNTIMSVGFTTQYSLIGTAHTKNVLRPICLILFHFIKAQSHFTASLVLRAAEYHASGPKYRIIHAKIQSGRALLVEMYQMRAPMPIAPPMM